MVRRSAGGGSQDVRLKAAQSEKEYQGAGQKTGLEIWRVEKLAIKRWPQENYGKFFEGDSFIVLKTYVLELGCSRGYPLDHGFMMFQVRREREQKTALQRSLLAGSVDIAGTKF